MGGRLGFPFTLIYHPTLEYYAFLDMYDQYELRKFKFRI
jgi:hypothetical protein